MAIVNGYAGLDDLKSWIDEDLDTADANGVLEQAIEVASRWIDGRCDRQFYTVTGARTFDACGRWELRIDDATAITQVATDDNADGVFETVWAPSEWQPIRNAGPAPEARPYRRIRSVSGRTFPRVRYDGRNLLVEVTATWGWATVPEAVHQACLMQASRLIKRRSSPEGITGFGSEFGHIRISQRGDPDVEALLAPYRAAVLVA